MENENTNAKIQEEESSSEDALLYEYNFDYTAEEAEKYRKSVRPEVLTERRKRIAIIMFIAGVAIAILLKSVVIGVSIAFIAGSWIGTPLLLDFIRGKKFYRANQPFWNRRVHISIFEEHVEYDVLKHELAPVKESKKKSKYNEEVVSHRDFVYEDFYKTAESPGRFYIIGGNTSIIILNTERAPGKLIRAIENMYEERDF